MSGTAPTPMAKIAAARLADLAPHCDLPPDAVEAIGTAADVPAALALLEAGGHLVEATRLLARALPKREAVWWACMCARHTTPEGLPELEAKAVTAAEAWVRSPTDPLRRAAFAFAQEAGFGGPEAWAAVAAFWSGDSMSPLGQPIVPPPPQAFESAVAGAVALASVREFPLRRLPRLTSFLAAGREIASGGTGRMPPETA